MANKKFWLGILAVALVFGMALISCDNDINDIPDITYTATADSNNTETTTKINFVFSAGVKLTAENITITAGTGAASKGTLTGSGTNWSLSITVATAGTVKVKIAKDGIESGEKTVTVRKTVDTPTAITYTITANGMADTETTTRLTFAFSAAVSGLTTGDIIVITDMGSASKGTLTGSGTNWSLVITVATAGTVKVKIAKTGIESGEKTVTVHKAADTSSTITYIVTPDGTAGTLTTTQLNFVFSEEVNDLTAEDITITAGTGSVSRGTLTGSGTDWNLSITVSKAGTVKVKIAKDGIQSGEKTVTVRKATITYTVTANGTADTETTTQLNFVFSEAVSGLTAGDIIMFDNTGSANKGTLIGSGTDWNLSITVSKVGTIRVYIIKTGIEVDPKTVTVHKATITYTVTANGTVDMATTTQLNFVFSEAVSGLSSYSITITTDTGIANKETLTGSGTDWNLGITVVSAGTVKVKIAKTGIESGEKTVTVHKNTSAGSNKEQAIPLSITEWKDGAVVTGDTMWYKFEAASGTSYCVQWKDKNNKPDSDNYTASLVLVTAYKNDGTTIISNFNESSDGWKWPHRISEVSGTIYLKVEPYSTYDGTYYDGTYAIRFYNPAVIVPQIPMIISLSPCATPGPSVILSWNQVWNNTGVSGYRVYRSNTETGTYTQIGSDITSYLAIGYTDTSVSAGNTYWYKIAAYNSVGEGDKSDVKQSDTVPSTSVGTSLVIGATLTEGYISTATQIDWYRFTAVSGSTYKVQWTNLSETPSVTHDYTAVVRVSVFKSDGTPIFQNSIQHWTYPETVSGVSGVVYIKVEASSSTSTRGAYGIRVYQ